MCTQAQLGCVGPCCLTGYEASKGGCYLLQHPFPSSLFPQQLGGGHWSGVHPGANTVVTLEGLKPTILR